MLHLYLYHKYKESGLTYTGIPPNTYAPIYLRNVPLAQKGKAPSDRLEQTEDVSTTRDPS